MPIYHKAAIDQDQAVLLATNCKFNVLHYRGDAN
jgi:hypothetical protein